MAEIAKEKGIPIEIGTFESWDSAERHFDLVVFGSSFHWVNPDIAVPKVHRLLRRGGRLALMWNRLIPTHPSHNDFAGIYRDYMDAGSPLVDGSWDGLVETDRHTDGLIAAIAASGFTVAQHSYPRHDHFSTEHWLDLAFTYSDHLILAAETAAELRARLAECIGSKGVVVGGDTLLVLATRA